MNEKPIKAPEETQEVIDTLDCQCGLCTGKDK